MIKYADLNTEPTLTEIRGSYSWVSKDSRFMECDRRVDWQLPTFLTTAFYSLKKEAASFSVNIYQRKRSYVMGVLVFVSLITSVWLSKKLFWDDLITHSNTYTYIHWLWLCVVCCAVWDSHAAQHTAHNHKQAHSKHRTTHKQKRDILPQHQVNIRK